MAEAARHGLAPVNGSAPGVGVVSYTLGGGVGLLGRRFGYAADRVRRIDLVTGDGRPRRVTADSDPELFWGLRGGGGGLGVVTGMEIGLVPVAGIYGGQLVFDGARHADEVLSAWQRWTATVPETMSSAVSLLPVPDIPAVPAHRRGRYLAQVHLAFTGSREEGERLVEPLRTIGAPLADDLREMPYAECASIFSEPDTPHAYRSTNLLLGPDGLAEDALRSVRAATGPEAEAMCVLSMRHMGGAFARPPRVPNAVPHRDAGYLLYVLSPFTAPGEGSDAEAVRALHERALAPAAGCAVGRNANFLYGPQSPGTLREVYGDGRAAGECSRLARLRALKQQYDPEGLFRFSLLGAGGETGAPNDAPVIA